MQRTRVWQGYQRRERATKPPRQFNAYSVGLPKTGTHSIAEMLDYRSSHEPEKNIVAYLYDLGQRGKISVKEQAAVLVARDTSLWLEVESNWMLGLVIEAVVEAFPDSHFVLTVRDPRSWLESIINQSIEPDRAEVFRRMFDAMFGGLEHGTNDDGFRSNGLYSLVGYLRHWAEQTQRVLDAVPRRQLFVVRTNEITDRAGDVARFIGSRDVLRGSTKSFVRKNKRLKLDDIVDGDFLAVEIERLTRKTQDAVSAAIEEQAGW